MPVLHSYGRFIRGTGSVLFLGSGRCITGDDGNDDDGVNPPLATEDTEEGAETAASSRTSYNTTKRLKTTTSSTSPTPPSAAAVPGKITSTTGSETAVDRFKLVPAHQRTFDRNWAEGVNLQDTFRYFSGEEMARLMGFPIGRDRDERVSVTSWPEDNGEEDGGRSGIEGGKKETENSFFHTDFNSTTF